jgi:hypothetical protein
LKESGVEIHVLWADYDNLFEFWTEVASPDRAYADYCPQCYNYNNLVLNGLLVGLTGINGTGCSILGANPKVYTFDGNSYTFNGLGDYWFVKSTRTLFHGDTFGIQLRMAPCDNSAPESGTCVRAAAFLDYDGNTAIFWIDPATGLLTTYSSDDGYMIRNLKFTDSSFLLDYVVTVEPISTPYSSSIGYKVTLRHTGDNSLRTFGFALGEKMGVNTFAILNHNDIGSVKGLCGTFDGCTDNDYYSASQQFVSIGDSPANVFNGFADTCKLFYGYELLINVKGELTILMTTTFLKIPTLTSMPITLQTTLPIPRTGPLVPTSYQ